MTLIQQLREKRRKFTLPVRLVLSDGESVVCEQTLRVLPGKRVVLKAQWRGREVLLKLMPNSATGKRNAKREMTGHQLLKASGVMTPELLLATRCVEQSYVLIYELLTRGQLCGQVWERHTNRRPEIAAAMIQVIALLHRNGCQHLDPHLNNFYQLAGRLYAIDAGAVKRPAIYRLRGRGHIRPSGSRLYAWQRANLARFFAFFVASQQVILWELLATHYAEATRDSKLESAIARSWQHRKSRYLKKCFRECSDFCVRNSWQQNAVWQRSHQGRELSSFLQNPDAWMEKGELVQNSDAVTVVRVRMDGQQVDIKKYPSKNILHALMRIFFANQCRTDWHNAHSALFAGVATPEPIAFVETRYGPICVAGYYVAGSADASMAGQ